MKRVVIPILLFGLIIFGTSLTPQFTKVAVVDVSRVFSAFYGDTQEVKDYMTRKADIDSELKKASDEISALKTQKAEADKLGNNELSNMIDSDIAAKTNAFKELYKVRTAELSALQKTLPDQQETMKKIYAEIKKTAQDDGNSIVINYNNNDSIVWFSPTIDYTDKIVANLRKPAAK